jgi:hypothetical protein
VDPQDRYDVISTIGVYQDIAHHALLKQLEDYEADRLRCSDGNQTGHVKAISNLGKLKMVAIMKPQIMLLPSHTNRFLLLN